MSRRCYEIYSYIQLLRWMEVQRKSVSVAGPKIVVLFLIFFRHVKREFNMNHFMPLAHQNRPGAWNRLVNSGFSYSSEKSKTTMKAFDTSSLKSYFCLNIYRTSKTQSISNYSYKDNINWDASPSCSSCSFLS